MIRVINAAVLYELSLVTRPAYPGTEVEERDLQSFFSISRAAQAREIMQKDGQAPGIDADNAGDSRAAGAIQRKMTQWQ